MELDAFWEWIDRARAAADGDLDELVPQLREALNAASPDDVLAVGVWLYTLRNRAYSWDLWAAAYLLRGGCSDDSFSDFRAWLIGKGRAAYEGTLANADSLVDHLDPDGGPDPTGCTLEELMYLPSEVYEAKTGKDFYDAADARIEPSAAEPSGEPFSEDYAKLLERLPRLGSYVEEHGCQD